MLNVAPPAVNELPAMVAPLAVANVPVTGSAPSLVMIWNCWPTLGNDSRLRARLPPANATVPVTFRLSAVPRPPLFVGSSSTPTVPPALVTLNGPVPSVPTELPGATVPPVPTGPATLTGPAMDPVPPSVPPWTATDPVPVPAVLTASRPAPVLVRLPTTARLLPLSSETVW